MTSVQIWGLALGTVLLANATAVGIYLINSSDKSPAQDAATEVADDSDKTEVDAATDNVEKHVVKSSGYSKTPYSEHYAIIACEDEVENKFSEKLVHKHVVDLSTRYDDYVEYFVVVVYAHLGTREDYSEVKVYCHVDPKKYTLSYFKDYPA